MALSHSPKIVTDGLVLYYDMYNTQKSFKGQPVTNLITGPEDFSNAAWGVANFSVTQNSTVAPNNTQTADLITSTSGDPYTVQVISVTSGVSYTWSFYTKANNCAGKTGYIWVWYAGTATGTNVGTYYTLTSEWQRVSITTTPTGSGTVYFRIDFVEPGAVTGDSVYAWGAQVETNSYMTPYTSSSRTNAQAIIDLTGNNTITANSLTYDSNNTFSFNGSSNYESVINSSALQVADTFTISAWIYATDLSNRYTVFSTRTLNTAGCWQMEVGTGSSVTTGSNLGRVAVTGVGTWIFESNDNAISINQWYNICFVKLNNATQGGTFYVNGVSVSASQTTSYTISNNSDAKLIGAGTGITQFFPGKISAIKLYNKALTAEQVLQNFNSTRIKYGI